ncbi:MAG: DUF2948 family protein [Phenylobacterium sp.]
MHRAPPLRLLAQEPEDLEVISAAMQDAVAKVGDISFEPKARRLTIACIFESIKPEESSPLHIPRTARKIDGRRA